MKRVRRSAMAALVAVLSAAALLAPSASGMDRPGVETVTKVRKALERLPYYGVFDFLAFGFEDGVLVLKGYAHRPALKREAEEMVRHATGTDVANRIEVLPTSSFDDRIRWATFQQIYTDDLADKYVPGGVMEARYELLDMLRFPGMEPYGTYPVHIIVKDRRVALIGVVDNESDKAIVFTRASHVGGIKGTIENLVMVRAK